MKRGRHEVRRDDRPHLAPRPAPDRAVTPFPVSTTAATVIGDIALVIAVSSLFGAAARRCGQPTVVGQLLAGLALGPSLLGRLPGQLTDRLFPPQVLSYLTILAEVAVAIFMFTAGYEIDLRSLRGRSRAIPLVASAALLLPMALGGTCPLLFRPGFDAAGEPHQDHSLMVFMAVATSITALPVLAAIVRERELTGTVAGVVAMAAAGVMDVAAWLALAAALIGTGRSHQRPWLMTLLLITCFVTLMLLVVRALLRWWIGRYQCALCNMVPVAFAMAMGGAWVTASLGLQPVFGAFLAGLTMRCSSQDPDADVLRSMEQAANLLLPLFFVVTGLSVNIGAVHGSALALLALLVTVACTGKLVPAYLAARVSGLERRQSATVAALVNTRGLTELIALNVGLDAGIIDGPLFTTLVFMALITTFATGPLLSLIRPRWLES